MPASTWLLAAVFCDLVLGCSGPHKKKSVCRSFPNIPTRGLTNFSKSWSISSNLFALVSQVSYTSTNFFRILFHLCYQCGHDCLPPRGVSFVRSQACPHQLYHCVCPRHHGVCWVQFLLSGVNSVWVLFCFP